MPPPDCAKHQPQPELGGFEQKQLQHIDRAYIERAANAIG
jgi:hypothetical protein